MTTVACLRRLLTVLRAARLAGLVSTLLLVAALNAAATERALLVGVSQYPSLAGRNLQGPVNDLRLMRRALVRLGVEEDRIIELSEAGGPSRWPTRANILGSLDTLARQGRPGDTLIVYFSGHGTQVAQSADTRRRYLEPDRLDEVFLPRDVRRWNAQKGLVEGGILDDEFAEAFQRVRSAGVRLWAIFDTCHAGDMARSAASASDGGGPVWRFVAPEELGVPTARIPGAGRRSPAIGAGSGWAGASSAGGFVGFFASQPDEGAAEEMLDDPDDPLLKRRFGVFTHSVVRALQQGPATFSDLARAVETAYQQRPFPTPRFEGDLSKRVPGPAPAHVQSSSRLLQPSAR